MEHVITTAFESEFAYLYKDKKLIFDSNPERGHRKHHLHYGTLYLYGGGYQDAKEMAKITSDALLDHWQVEVLADFARIQYS